MLKCRQLLRDCLIINYSRREVTHQLLELNEMIRNVFANLHFSDFPVIFLKFIKSICLDAAKNVQLMALTFSLITLSFKNTVISRKRIELNFYLFTLLVALETAFQSLNSDDSCPRFEFPTAVKFVTKVLLLVYYYLIAMLIR